ncbi:MAG TPA: urease accessory protein UreD [Kofleriaceae bacterium]|nr:urease accessory protein UreD [Kofleriaceae bacterium]
MSAIIRRRFTGATLVPAAPQIDRVARGRVRVGRVRGREGVLALEVHSPLRMLVARVDRAVCLMASTVSGGLAGGDRVVIDASVEDGARALLASSAADRVEAGERAAHADLRAQVAGGGVLAVLPAPVRCAAGAHLEQRAEIDLAPDASAAVLDLFDGDGWSMASLRADLTIAGLRDTLLIDAAHGSIARRLGRFGALARLVLAGPAFADARARITAAVAADGGPGAPVIETTAGDADVLILRLAAVTLDDATTRLRSHLAEVTDLCGEW